MNKADHDEFVYYLKLGFDLTFSYKGKKYIVEGTRLSENLFQLDTIQIEPFDPTVCFRLTDMFNYDVEGFFNTPFFDGKTFSQIEPEVELLPD